MDKPRSRKPGWLYACKPGSPALEKPLDFNAPIPPEFLNRKSKTFIHDHDSAMDPCQHPSQLFLNGQFLAHRNGPATHARPIPQFSSSITHLHYDLLPIPPPGWAENEQRRDVPWAEKRDERLLWRGLNTGMYASPETRWHQSQRFRLVEMANSVDGALSVLRPPRKVEEGLAVGEAENWDRAVLNPAIMDVAFAGDTIQCEGLSCGEISNDYEWRERMDTDEANQYKYVIDVSLSHFIRQICSAWILQVDGNGWSSRFRRLVTSNALIFKSASYREWSVLSHTSSSISPLTEWNH